LVGSSWGNQ